MFFECFIHILHFHKAEYFIYIFIKINNNYTNKNNNMYLIIHLYLNIFQDR